MFRAIHRPAMKAAQFTRLATCPPLKISHSKPFSFWPFTAFTKTPQPDLSDKGPIPPPRIKADMDFAADMVEYKAEWRAKQSARDDTRKILAWAKKGWKGGKSVWGSTAWGDMMREEGERRLEEELEAVEREMVKNGELDEEERRKRNEVLKKWSLLD